MKDVYTKKAECKSEMSQASMSYKSECEFTPIATKAIAKTHNRLCRLKMVAILKINIHMKSKRNLIPIHYLSLHDLRETVTFDGINFHDWNHALKAFLKNDEKLYVLKVPVPEQPPLTSRTDHDVWWKHKCDAEDVSEIIMGTVIPDLQKIFDTDDAYKMYCQMTQIYQQLIIKCFKPVETLDADKVDGSYTVCSKRPMVQNKEKYKRRKTKKAPKNGSCFYCGEIGHWKRNCSSYLTELRKSERKFLIDKASGRHMELEVDQEPQLDLKLALVINKKLLNMNNSYSKTQIVTNLVNLSNPEKYGFKVDKCFLIVSHETHQLPERYISRKPLLLIDTLLKMSIQFSLELLDYIMILHTSLTLCMDTCHGGCKKVWTMKNTK
ncbi:LOW QUALITY PROTEIN: hypothetical protein OSB04_un000817 [Centaurea solstitialis]|uniref:CCHC-type domain-containing protein n=1 Tax=Centaurea solstitialis TaxID=347529 RepID=A0AA38S3E8_9ASTR|nr:LOW QUALITY PROTEIN: hypothetical protein OSB04_un000817 [Centaurea solstitialis]